MVYCDQDMCESKLGRLMQAFRADRPDEWTMDEFIGMAENMHKINKELIVALGAISFEDRSWQIPTREDIRELIAKAKGIA